ncbi:MAG: DUF3786 domain-containing protein [Thermacetogeniaceae bacterium]
MEEKRVCFNRNKGYMNLEATLELAQRVFSEKKPLEVKHRLGVEYDDTKNEFILLFLNEEHRIKYPSGDVYRPDGRDIPLVNRILILHYLNSSKGVPVKNKWISFKELPSGQIYIDPFYNRAIRPLISIFGDKPERMVDAGRALGGKEGEIGDVSIIVPAFPLVPVAYVIWRGDEEFPPSGNILFDESAPDHLPTEDYAVLASTIVFEMKRLAET